MHHDAVRLVRGVRVVHPLGGVSGLERNEGEGDGEVDEVEVEVVQPEVVEGALARVADVFLAVVGVPELGRDPEVLARAHAGGERGGDACANLALVAVIARAVDVAPAPRDGLADERRALIRGDLPRAEAEERHARAGAQQSALRHPLRGGFRRGIVTFRGAGGHHSRGGEPEPRGAVRDERVGGNETDWAPKTPWEHGRGVATRARRWVSSRPARSPV